MRIYARLLKQGHHNLQTFLQYADRTELSKDSTIFVGTRYEYQVQASLKRFGFGLERIGARGDLGVDLRGTWNPPSLLQGRSLSVFVQCKWIDGRRPVPHMIRELEGAFTSASSAWRRPSHVMHSQDVATAPEENFITDKKWIKPKNEVSDSTTGSDDIKSRAIELNDEGIVPGSMALLTTPLQATKGIRNAMERSRWPLAYAMLNEVGGIEQFFWNTRSAAMGLEGLKVETVHKPRSSGPKLVDTDTLALTKELVLTWQGQIWSPSMTA